MKHLERLTKLLDCDVFLSISLVNAGYISILVLQEKYDHQVWKTYSTTVGKVEIEA